jgi:hypothetical protein
MGSNDCDDAVLASRRLPTTIRASPPPPTAGAAGQFCAKRERI